MSTVTSPVYTLVSGAGSTDNSKFQITGNQLKTRSSFNFETKSSYSIRVQMRPSTGVVNQVFTIQVDERERGADRSDALPGDDRREQCDRRDGRTLAGVDPDIGDTLNYTLVPGSGSTDNSRFTIDGNQLKAAAVFDYETKRSYSIRVRSPMRTA